MITIELLTDKNFYETSLDDFDRKQNVAEVYRKTDGEYKLVLRPFVDNWTPECKRQKARDILSDDYITYGAIENARIVGFVMLCRKPNGNRLIVDNFQVSREFRRRGIGRKLFSCAVSEGKKACADALYISACSSKETIAFYKAMGCVLSENVIPEMAEDEPYDLQLEYKL